MECLEVNDAEADEVKEGVHPDGDEDGAGAFISERQEESENEETGEGG